MNKKVGFTLKITKNSPEEIDSRSVELHGEGMYESALAPFMLTIDTKKVKLELVYTTADEIEAGLVGGLYYTTLDSGHPLWPEPFPVIKEVIEDIINQK